MDRVFDIDSMAERDGEPLQQLCRGLQTHWSGVARNAGALHGFCGGQLQRLLISSGMVNQQSGPTPAHFHRRKPAFASVSLDTATKSSKKDKKEKKVKKDREESKDQEEMKGKEEKKDKKHKDRDTLPGLSKKQRKVFKAEVQKLPLEEQEAWCRDAIKANVMAQSFVYEGREVTLAQLTEEVKEQEAQHLRGAVESTGKRGSGKRGSGKRDLGNRGSGPIVESVADRERGAADSTGKSESGLEKVPGWELRPGAPKMQLRPKEEALLPLDLLGKGALWSKRPVFGYLMGGYRDAAFGVYAKCGILRQLLKGQWAGHDPDEVLEDEGFYNDIIASGGMTELTLMAVPSRNISLPTLRKHVEKRMLQNLDLLAKCTQGNADATVDPKDEEALKKLCDSLDSTHLSKTGFVKGDQILSGTNFIFSTTRNGCFTAEAILPFKELKDRKTVYLLRNQHPNLTYAFWGMVLGPRAISADAKLNVGQAALYITNGFEFGPNPGNPNQVLIADPENEPTSPFPEPPSADDIRKQLPGGSLSDAFSFTEDPEEVLRVVSSERQAKHEKKLQDSRQAAEAQQKKGQKKTHKKSDRTKRGKRL